MSIEPEIKTAIRETVKKMNQPDSVADRMIAWLEAMSQSDIKEEEKLQRLETIYDVILTQKGDSHYED